MSFTHSSILYSYAAVNLAKVMSIMYHQQSQYYVCELFLGHVQGTGYEGVMIYGLKQNPVGYHIALFRFWGSLLHANNLSNYKLDQVFIF